MQSTGPRTLVCNAILPPLSPQRLLQQEFNLRNPKTETWRIRVASKGFSGVRRKDTAPPRREEVTTRGGGGGGGGGERDVISEEVLVRISVSVLVPAAAGLGLMHVFGVVKQQGLWDVPVWVVVPTTFACLAASALGVAYGGLSTSWDPDRRGSLIGLEEAQKNWVDLWKEDPEED